jgi:hypothetical protein
MGASETEDDGSGARQANNPSGRRCEPSGASRLTPDDAEHYSLSTARHNYLLNFKPLGQVPRP